MSERNAVSVGWRGKTQVIEWDDGTTTQSWPLTCRNCGYSTADWWEKTYDFAHLEFGDDTSIPLCSERCLREFAG